MGAQAKPLVSICIPAYARPEPLRRAIASALAQTWPAIEVVVSDDSGRNSTVVTAFDDPRVRYSRNAERLGMAGNFRRALELGHGEFSVLLNDDDRLEPTFVETLVAPLIQDPRRGVAFCDIATDVDGVITARETRLASGDHLDFLRDLVTHLPIMCSAALMRREVWERDGAAIALRDTPLADTLIWIHAATKGWRFHYVPKPLSIYSVGSEGSLSGEQASMRGAWVELWSSLNFDDPDVERVRCERLAEALVSRAAWRIRHSDRHGAVNDLHHAQLVEPSVLRSRRLLLDLLARTPALRTFVPLAEAMWRSVRPVRRFLQQLRRPSRLFNYFSSDA